MSQEAAALVAALGLAAVHLLSGRLHFLGGVPRSAFLSAFAGVSVAYVFAHLLPELAEGQEAVSDEGLAGFLEDHVYLMALLGMTVFYGVEKHSLASRRERQAEEGEDRTTGDAFWLSIGSFAVYNAIVGYLLLRGELEAADQLVLYTLALALHFVVNDFGLREHHKDAYDRVGRYVIAVAALAGWWLGTLLEFEEHQIAFVLAFIGGGVILNVLKEELPGERQARFTPFALGAAGYAALLQLI